MCLVLGGVGTGIETRVVLGFLFCFLSCFRDLGFLYFYFIGFTFIFKICVGFLFIVLLVLLGSSDS